MKAEAIFTYWNQSEGLIRHKELKHDIKIAIKGALANFTVDDIKGAIANYSMVVSGDKYWWTHRWALGKFLTTGEENSKTSPRKWWRFLENNFDEEIYLFRNRVTDPFIAKPKVKKCRFCDSTDVAVTEDGKGSRCGSADCREKFRLL